ncbi:MAG: hypothetical protein ACYC9J_00735 [Sulfuricaulis sp.]
MSAVISLAKERGTNLYLCNVEEAESFGPLLAIFNLPDRQYSRKALARSSRIAVILLSSPTAREDTRFFETVCLNRGWLAKVAATRQEAIGWLLGDARSNHPVARNGVQPHLI